MKVVFFGTPQFAAEALSFLLKHQVDVVAVITKPDKPKGRSGTPLPTPVKKVAEANLPPIPVFQPEKVSGTDFVEGISKLDADLFVVVAYGEILKQHVLDAPRLGCINLHASLLPKYRGAAPIQRCIINGETETGVTIMHMVLKMDAGDIIKTLRVPIGPNDTFGEIQKQLCEKGSKLLLEAIRDFEHGRVSESPQNESEATYAHKLELEDCEIDWTLPCQKIHDLVRGVNPYPGAWCFVEVNGEKKRLKIHTTRTLRDVSGQPGEILACNAQGMVVACGKDAVNILLLQLEGKRPMTPNELVRGVTIKFLRF